MSNIDVIAKKCFDKRVELTEAEVWTAVHEALIWPAIASGLALDLAKVAPPDICRRAWALYQRDRLSPISAAYASGAARQLKRAAGHDLQPGLL